MRRTTKRLIYFAATMLTLTGLVWFALAVRRGIVAGYCEWGTTCIIASYAEENDGTPPRSWDDLVGYEYHSQYLPLPRTIDYASSHVAVNFKALSDFHAGRIDQLPDDVIHPTRGLTARHINPKLTLERYFRDGELPHGSFNRDIADEQRSYAEADTDS